MIEDFSDHPPTIGDLKSDKSGNAKDWSVRDALIATLRQIDKGEIKPRMCVLVMSVEKDRVLERGESPYDTMTRQAGTTNVYETYGLLAWAQQVIGKD